MTGRPLRSRPYPVPAGSAAAVAAAGAAAKPTYDAVILAGGAARRLGGVDKTGLLLAGRSLLDRVIAAVPDADRLIVVGPRRSVGAAVRWVQEEPPGGGPVAGIAAALPQVSAPVVAVLAGDLPFLTQAALDSLRLALVPPLDGALLVDDTGRDQLLTGVWQTAVLRAGVNALATPVGASVRRLFGQLRVVRVPAACHPSDPPPWWDCDTPGDVERARSWL